MGALETIQEILLSVMADGIDEGFQLFTGLYNGKVTDNKDPKERGAVKVLMTDFGHTEAMNVWVMPVFALAGKDRGAFYPPEIGDMVRVVFFAGDQSRPLAYFPGWYLKDALPSEFKHGDDHTPYVRGVITRGGHSILMSDEPDNEFVQIAWHQPGASLASNPSESADRTPGQGKLSWFRFDTEGFQLSVNGAELTMSYLIEAKQFQILDSFGNQINMDDEGVKIQDTKNSMIGMYGGDISLITEGKLNIAAKEIDIGGAGVSLGGTQALFSAVIGEVLMTWLSAHTHVAAGATAPTGPAVAAPTGPPPPNALSKSIKVKF